MYTRKELERRIFAPDKEARIEAALKDYRSKEEAKVQTVERGIILPLKRIAGTGSYAGGVCDEGFNFVAGFRRDSENQVGIDCLQSYAVDGGGVQHIHETVIFGGTAYTHFGHALLECLSRLWFVAESGAAERIAVLPYDGLPRTKDLYNAFFELLGIDLKRIIYIEAPVQFDRVIVPDQTIYVAGRHAQYKEKYTIPYEKMMSRVEAKSAKKIYLTRSQLGRPDCLNEEYFEEFYRRRGFKIIAPERHSIKEQVAYMKGAEEIACTLGTLSHLALFARPGTKLTCLVRCSGVLLSAQEMINQAKQLNFFVIDVALSFLPTIHISSCFLLGPSKHWKEYLDATGEEHSARELEWDKSKWAYEYLLLWCRTTCDYRGWNFLCKFDNFDFLNMFSTALLDAPLKREDYPGSFKEKVAALEAEVERLKAAIADPDTKRFEAEIEALQAESKALKSEVWMLEYKLQSMRNSLVWVLARPLKKLYHKLGARTQKRLRAMLMKVAKL